MMKRKINVLIGLSTAMLLILCAIQVYLVKTAYDYKVEQFRAEVKDKIGNITNNFTDLDSSVFYKKELLYQRIAEKFIANKNYRVSVKKELLSNAFREALTQRMREKFRREFKDNEVDFAVIINKFIVFDNTAKTDTIFSEKPKISNALYGNLASLDDALWLEAMLALRAILRKVSTNCLQKIVCTFL